MVPVLSTPLCPFGVWVGVWVLPRPSPRPKLVYIEKVKKKAQILSDLSLFGGDYRTRICDLLRVKIRRDENRVLFAPFGAVYSNKVSGWSLSSPMAPSAHFGVWVSVWVSAKLHQPAPLHENRLGRKFRPPSDGEGRLHQMVGGVLKLSLSC